jgi:hypothetical protein
VLPGRRAWWVASGAVACGIAAVKAGSRVHGQGLGASDDAIGPGAALLEGSGPSRP